VWRVFAPLVLAACGCSSVRLVREAPDGGVVSIPNDSNQWPTYYRNRAEQLMRKKCPAGYVIDHEVAVEDNPAERDGRYPNEDFDYNGGFERIRRYARNEYHIYFHCAPAGGQPPPDWPH
jgi:hypothetical protein